MRVCGNGISTRLTRGGKGGCSGQTDRWNTLVRGHDHLFQIYTYPEYIVPMITMNIVTNCDDGSDVGRTTQQAGWKRNPSESKIFSHRPNRIIRVSEPRERFQVSCGPRCALFKFPGVFHAYDGRRPLYLGMKFGPPCLCSIGNSDPWPTFNP